MKRDNWLHNKSGSTTLLKLASLLLLLCVLLQEKRLLDLNRYIHTMEGRQKTLEASSIAIWQMDKSCYAQLSSSDRIELRIIKDKD